MVDIGARAGVSQATVSLVLNGAAHARVSEATRQRVLEAAEALSYRRGPRHAVPSGRKRVIALFLDEVSTTPFAMQFLEGARDEAALQEVVVATYCTGGDPALENAALDLLGEDQVIGIIYASLVTRQVELPARFHAYPTVLLNCYEQKRRHPSIVPGDLAGGHSATEALLKAGHRRIAHLAGEDWIDAARDRLQGYKQALATWDVPFDPELVLVGGWTVVGGRELAHKALSMPDPPTALFCFNDRMAMGAYDAVRAHGLSVPEDISIIGFDDEELSAYLIPPLSTAVLPHDEMARWAVGMLLEHHAGVSAHQRAQKIKVACPLVLRGSVAPPKVTRSLAVRDAMLDEDPV